MVQVYNETLLSLSPKALTLSTGHTRILKAHAIYKVWDHQRRAGCGGLCVCVWALSAVRLSGHEGLWPSEWWAQQCPVFRADVLRSLLLDPPPCTCWHLLVGVILNEGNHDVWVVAHRKCSMSSRLFTSSNTDLFFGTLLRSTSTSCVIGGDPADMYRERDKEEEEYWICFNETMTICMLQHYKDNRLVRSEPFVSTCSVLTDTNDLFWSECKYSHVWLLPVCGVWLELSPSIPAPPDLWPQNNDVITCLGGWSDG